MTFPTAGSQIYRNEEGEVTGWDGPESNDPPDDSDPFGDDGYYDDEDDDEDDDDGEG